MKATVVIPSDELRDAMRFTKPKTKREARVAVRLREIEMRVREAVAQHHRPQAVELVLRPSYDELELWPSTDNGAA